MASKKKLLDILEQRGLEDINDCSDFLSLLNQLDREYKNDHRGKENKELHDRNKMLKRKLLIKINDSKLDIEQREAFMRIYKQSLLFDAYSDFDSYLLYIEFDRDPKDRFYMPRRRTLLKFGIIQGFQELEDDVLDLLTISLPPGTGKSTLGIFFLTWVMGKYPNECNLASAYGDKLTRSFFIGVLAIINDPEYLWHDVFPDVHIQQTNTKDETINLDKASRNQTLTCRSIDGSLTGATRCTKYLYADDLVSGIEEALSKPRMNTLWGKYGTDLKSRKKKKCKEIHIATRWTVHDPIGRIQNINKNNKRAKFISIPALDKEGKSNFNYDYDVGFDEKFFDEVRDTIDDVSFRALYMNEPVEREGLLYSPEDLKRYYELPEGTPDAIISVTDTAQGGGDYTCMLVGYIFGKEVYIEDLVFCKEIPKVTKPKMASCLLRNNVQRGQFESNNAGWAICDEIQKIVNSMGGRTKLTKKYTSKNKETKIIVNSDYVKDHFYFKDSSMYARNSEYADFIDAVLTYTLVGNNEHDDAVDTLAMLVLYIDEMLMMKPQAFARPM